MRESIKRGKIIEDRIKGIVLKWIIGYSLNTMFGAISSWKIEQDYK